MSTETITIQEKTWTLIASRQVAYQLPDQTGAVIAEADSLPVDLSNRTKLSPGDKRTFTPSLGAENLYIYMDVKGSITLNGPETTNTLAQDPTNPILTVNFNSVIREDELSALAAEFSRIIFVVDPTNISIGSYLIIFSEVTNLFSIGTVTGVNGNQITIDTPLSSEFPIGSKVDITSKQMNVNGSIIPVTFGLRGIDTPARIDRTIHITRIMTKCFTTTAVTLGQFGNIAELPLGLVLRKRGAVNFTIYNVKNNGEIDQVSGDWKDYAVGGQAQDGFTDRFTFEKLGAVISLSPGEDLEFLIQDDLTLGTPNITSYTVLAELHIAD